MNSEGKILFFFKIIMITILNKHSVKVSTKSESGCGDDYLFHLE